MIIIGHRGARGLTAENTLASVQTALEYLQFTGGMIEFDVRVSSDEEAVLSHDAVIKNRNGAAVKIKDCTLEELRRYKPDLTLLATVLEQIDTKVTPYIEIKPGEPIEPILKVLNRFVGPGKMYAAADVRIASKSQSILEAFHTQLPDVPLIVIEPWSSWRARRRANRLHAREIAMNKLWLWSGFIRIFSRSFRLYAYTVNDPAKVQRWQKAGLAGVVTDYPDRFDVTRKA